MLDYFILDINAVRVGVPQLPMRSPFSLSDDEEIMDEEGQQ